MKSINKKTKIVLFSFIFSFCTFAQDLKYSATSFNIWNSNEVINTKESHKKIYINFWASWCTSCIEELPILEKVKNDPKNKDIIFIAVNVGDNDRKIQKFINKYGFSYKMVKDEDKSISKSWNVLSLPQTIVIQNEKIIYQGTKPLVE